MLGEAAGVWIRELIYVSALIVNVLWQRMAEAIFKHVFFSLLFIVFMIIFKCNSLRNVSLSLSYCANHLRPCMQCVAGRYAMLSGNKGRGKV